ncbi:MULTISPECIES: hypothetical protein [Rhodococcus erythropolis group]|uniref:hypothetical protein n=1 Tax=Rhodococcus erythropolis group TaxID=2840174 RepID=UPI0004234448|nr:MULTISPECIES: hypothetical protein [Rhodococcus erythropolis group]MBO8150499.1 hypothetical protein [Rhodococcus erythropolis]MDO1488313.1 hypothetical protein [Rhodococcus erythropolis]
MAPHVAADELTGGEVVVRHVVDSDYPVRPALSHPLKLCLYGAPERYIHAIFRTRTANTRGRTRDVRQTLVNAISHGG